MLGEGEALRGVGPEVPRVQAPVAPVGLFQVGDGGGNPPPPAAILSFPIPSDVVVNSREQRGAPRGAACICRSNRSN